MNFNLKMFIIILFTLIFIFSIFSDEKTAYPKSELKKVAILEFKSIEVEKSLTSAVMENFTTAIIDTKKFIVVERSQLDKVLSELKLSNTEDFKDTDAVKVGELSGANIVFIGSVTKIAGNITINVRGIDVEKGIALFAKKASTLQEKNIPGVIDELAQLIRRQFVKEEEEKKQNIQKEILKTKYTPEKVAGIACNTAGAVILVAGISLLASSLGYNNYLENNKTDTYTDYAQGKKVSQGLFYGSMAAIGSGTVCITVSIPLFVIKKKK